MKKLITLNETVEVLERLVSRKQISRTRAFKMLLEEKRFLDQPLTKEMFDGDKAIFVGFEHKERFLTRFLKNEDWSIYFNNSNGDFRLLRSRNDFKVYYNTTTLHDLAELTKANQLELK
jgi:hypothetical protein